ncbi:MAG: hypothetical protein ACE5F6_12315 [Anaerolineae bacterium]
MFRRYVWLTLTLLMAGLGQASMSMTRSLPTYHAAMAVDTATVAANWRQPWPPPTPTVPPTFTATTR